MKKVNLIDKATNGADTLTGCVVECNKTVAAQSKPATIVLVNSVVEEIKVVECENYWHGTNGVKYDKIQGRYIEGDVISRLILASIK